MLAKSLKLLQLCALIMFMFDLDLLCSVQYFKWYNETFQMQKLNLQLKKLYMNDQVTTIHT